MREASGWLTPADMRLSFRLHLHNAEYGLSGSAILTTEEMRDAFVELHNRPPGYEVEEVRCCRKHSKRFSPQKLRVPAMRWRLLFRLSDVRGDPVLGRNDGLDELERRCGAAKGCVTFYRSLCVKCNKRVILGTYSTVRAYGYGARAGDTPAELMTALLTRAVVAAPAGMTFLVMTARTCFSCRSAAPIQNTHAPGVTPSRPSKTGWPRQRP